MCMARWGTPTPLVAIHVSRPVVANSLRSSKTSSACPTKPVEGNKKHGHEIPSAKDAETAHALLEVGPHPTLQDPECSHHGLATRKDADWPWWTAHLGSGECKVARCNVMGTEMVVISLSGVRAPR